MPVLALKNRKDKVEIGAGLRWPRSLRIVYYDSVVRVGTIHKIPLVVFGRVHSWVVAPQRVLFSSLQVKEGTNELSAPLNAWRRFGMQLFHVDGRRRLPTEGCVGGVATAARRVRIQRFLLQSTAERFELVGQGLLIFGECKEKINFALLGAMVFKQWRLVK